MQLCQDVAEWCYSAKAQRVSAHLSIKQDLLLSSHWIYTSGRMEIQENKFYSVNCVQAASGLSVSQAVKWLQNSKVLFGLVKHKRIDLLSVSMSVFLWHSGRCVWEHW